MLKMLIVKYNTGTLALPESYSIANLLYIAFRLWIDRNIFLELHLLSAVYTNFYIL